MAILSWTRYGKSRIRLVKVRRPSAAARASTAPHDLIDLTIDVQLEGAFDAVYTDGDNASCLATDTMKNTVYAFARREPIDLPEPFALTLAEHFARQPPVARVTISMAEQPWERLRGPHAFVHRGAAQWTAEVVREAAAVQVRSGVTGLVVLKTTDSSFVGFARDAYTTLPEATDRILATSMTAVWTYRSTEVDFAARHRISSALTDTFAGHDSRSVQHTLFAMAEAALDAAPEIDDITLTMPNRHHLLVDLTPFGLDNPNEVFVATDQPFGLIEATVRRHAAR